MEWVFYGVVFVIVQYILMVGAVIIFCKGNSGFILENIHMGYEMVFPQIPWVIKAVVFTAIWELIFLGFIIFNKYID